MSKIEKNTDRSASEEEASAVAAAGLARRRRFVRLGASAVPIVMTLTSRPVMAWHCNTTSAWGSARLANNIGSAQTRLTGGVVNGNECWTISNWKNNTYGSPMPSQPWYAVQVALGVNDMDTAKAQLLIGAIFPDGLLNVASNTTVWSIVNGSAGFRRSVTVARLNAIYATAYKAKIEQCIVSADTGPDGGDQIQRMAKLGPNYYSPNAPTSFWTKAQIVEYLSLNWLAV